MATINWDIVDGAYARETADGMEINRPVGVEGLVGDASDVGKNPAVLLEALSAPGMPTRGSPHPKISDAYLEDRGARSIGAVSACIVDLIYRQRVIAGANHGSASTWSITDAYQVSQRITYASADGSKATTVWYLASSGSSISPGDITPPAGARIRTVGVHQYKVHRVITVSGRLTKSDWDSWKRTVRAAAGKINADTWGTDTRGTWLFMGPTTRFFDRNNNPSSIVYVELTFFNDPDGFYPLIGYIDPQGIHPADAATETEVRSFGGLPPVNGIVRRKGKTLVSVQGETNFSPLFAFTPDT
jgi:hypothetical protein